MQGVPKKRNITLYTLHEIAWTLGIFASRWIGLTRCQLTPWSCRHRQALGHMPQQGSGPPTYWEEIPE